MFLRARVLAAVLVSLTILGGGITSVSAEPPSDGAFTRTWERTDKPVADGRVNRTWMWGPDAFTQATPESYAESPGSQRTVQYFDKTRMEITNPAADPDSI